MPKTKKPSSSSDTDSDSGPEDRNAPPAKKSKAGKEKSTSESSSSSGPWIIEKLRQVRINEFKGRKMVDIREFYEKNGEILPGKKGISLHIHQWKKLLELAPEVNKALGE